MVERRVDQKGRAVASRQLQDGIVSKMKRDFARSSASGEVTPHRFFNRGRQFAEIFPLRGNAAAGRIVPRRDEDTGIVIALNRELRNVLHRTVWNRARLTSNRICVIRVMDSTTLTTASAVKIDNEDLDRINKIYRMFVLPNPVSDSVDSVHSVIYSWAPGPQIHSEIQFNPVNPVGAPQLY